MELKKMNIEDFKNQMYDEYTKLFPEDEQRDWEDIEKSYYDGVEILYGIIENGIVSKIIVKKVDILLKV